MFASLKQALTCKNVHQGEYHVEALNAYVPQTGDVAVFRVAKSNGAYIMDLHGRQCPIFDGDHVMLAFGNRYATNQVEGYVPSEPVVTCQLLGRGGVAGIVKSTNAVFKSMPADLELIGYALDGKGDVINTIQTAKLSTFQPYKINTNIILSVGSSMDSGKTTTAAWLCGGLRQAGFRVAYLKLTGTAFPKDAQLALARGAHYADDFSSFGVPSTYMLDKEMLLDVYQSLVDRCMQACHPEYIVIEIADGLLQRETYALLSDPAFMSTVHSIILSCGDSLGVLSGVRLLEEVAFRPTAVSGLFTVSELLIEEVQANCSIPVLRLNDLLNGERVRSLVQLEHVLVA